jgi:hypothetical protein
MLHFLHLLLTPIELLLGLFCVLTTILLCPGEEGQIQSKVEDFWVRVDDYRQLALSKHAAFMTQVAKLETSFLDKVFGPKLISGHALAVSFCCSVTASAVVGALVFESFSDVVFLALSIALLLGSIAVCITIVFVRKHAVVRGIAIGSLLVFLLIWAGYTQPGPEQAGRLTWDIVFAAFGSFVCDVIFIALTRRLLRWAGQMTSFFRVLAVIVLNFLLAVFLVMPLFLAGAFAVQAHEEQKALILPFALIGFSNLFDVVLSSFFVFLTLMLLIHRVLWPLLSRTLFRMQDIGTKGRRAILSAVGLTLIGWSGVHLPDLLKELLKILGKG